MSYVVGTVYMDMPLKPNVLDLGSSMMILILFGFTATVRFDTILVAKRVQQPEPTGDGMSVRLCSNDDFPVY